jgi:hypothetical protein
MKKDNPTLEEQIANWCKHFNGIHNDRCRVGIAYHDARFDKRLPCIKSDGCVRPCASAQFPSEQEVAERAERERNAAARYFELLAKDICPTCEQSVEKHQQVGRSVYAEPCGHRLYQGKATKL